MIRSSSVLALLLCAGTPALAHEVKFQAHRSGTLEEIHSDGLTIETAGKKQLAVVVNDITIVHRNGEDVALSDLRPGDHVLLEVMPEGKTGLYAVDITAKSPVRTRNKRKPR